MRVIARRHTDDEGTIIVLVVGLAFTLLMVAGLVYDGGQMLAARREAFDVANNAARAAAQAVDLDQLRATGVVVLDPVAAEAAARDYLDRVGHTGTVRVGVDVVEVTVSARAELAILSAIGIEHREVTGTGRARAIHGVTQEGG